MLAGLFSAWQVPTLIASRRRKARTKQRATRLLAAAGFQAIQWHDIETAVIRAVTARR